jgi:hypothetical protein
MPAGQAIFTGGHPVRRKALKTLVLENEIYSQLRVSGACDADAKFVNSTDISEGVLENSNGCRWCPATYVFREKL